MIDVPVQVKDALREGDRKKNYRVLVQSQQPVYFWTDIYTHEYTDEYEVYSYTFDENGVFRFHAPSGSGRWYTQFVYNGEVIRNGQTYSDMYYEVLSGTTVNINYSTSSLVIQKRYNEPEWHTDFTIDNDNLVAESISIDERMVSGDILKYGLCEGSSLEFKYFGKPNIAGKRVQVFIDVDYGISEPYTIPMGYFNVKKCSRQASTGIIKATCYNKLQSEYLDAKANDEILSIGSDIGTANISTIKNIMDSLLNGYMVDVRAIDPDYGTITIGATQYTVNYMAIDIKIVGQSTLYHWSISNRSPLTNPYNHNMHCNIETNKRIHITKLEAYITQLENVVASLKAYIYTNLQNPEATWELFKQNGISALGCVVHFYGDNVPALYVTDDMVPTTVTGNYKIIDSISKLKYLINVQSIDFNLIGVIHFLDSQGYPTGTNIFAATSNYNEDDFPVITITDNTDSVDNITVNVTELPDVTLRDIVSANYEMHCTFGQLSRETDLFSGVELNHSRLLPAETLYPDNALYPGGAAESAFRSQYSKLWADEGNIRKWRYLIITYKGLDENDQEVDLTLQRTVNADGTDDYNMSDNWLFRNLVWTAAQVGDYADAMVEKMQDITWFPFEMWAAGLPYLETGDEIEIPLGEETYTSYILQRQLKGIQNLQDTYINGTLDIF